MSFECSDAHFGALPPVGRHRRLFIIAAFNSLQDGGCTISPSPLLASGAGLEPASPACTGALTVELPRSCSLRLASSAILSRWARSPNGKLDMSDAVGHFEAPSVSDAVGHTAPPFPAFRMSDAVGRGVLRGRTGFCFF